MKNEMYRPSLARIKNAKSPSDLYCEVSNAIVCYNDGEYIHSKSLWKKYIITITKKLATFADRKNSPSDKELIHEMMEWLSRYYVNEVDSCILSEMSLRKEIKGYGGVSAKALLKRCQLSH